MVGKKSMFINIAEPSTFFTGSAIIAGATAQAEFGLDHKPTRNKTTVRVKALSKDLGTLIIDVVPYSLEVEERLNNAFDSIITSDNLVKPSACKIYTYDGELKVKITVRDIAV